MKHIQLLMLFILCASFIFGQAREEISPQINTQDNISTQQDSLVINLQQAIEIALNENLIIRLADMEIQKKKYVRKGTMGALFPQIDALVQYSRTIKKQTMYMDGDFPMGGKKIDTSNIPPHVKDMLEAMGMLGGSEETSKEGFQFGRLNMWTAGVSVNMPLIVPALWKTMALTSLDIEIAIEDANSSKKNLIDGVKRSYYAVLLGEDSYQAYKDMYENEKEVLQNIENNFKQGLIAEYDLITAQVRLQSLVPDLIQTKNALEMAKLQLKAMMGLDLDTPIKINEKLEEYQEKLYQNILKESTEENNEDDILKDNSELRKLDLQVKQLQKMYEVKMAEFLPKLFAGFKWNYLSQNNDFKFSEYRWDPFSTFDVTLSIPIFNGGTRTYEARATKLSMEQLSVQRIDLERKMKLSVQNQIDKIKNSIEQIKALQTTEGQAKLGYNIALKRYETGMGTLLELNQASFAMTNIRLQKSNAIFSYLMAKSELDTILGINDYTETK